MMIIDICIVKATRSQKPAPNHCAVCVTGLPMATLAAKTIATCRQSQREGVGEPALEPVRESQSQCGKRRSSGQFLCLRHLASAFASKGYLQAVLPYEEGRLKQAPTTC
jgi:hypothetical protein